MNRVPDREVDVLVVGAGPAGLGAARRLRELGVGSVEVVDREHHAGGIPRHCDHPGFGLRDLRRSLSGPAYAERMVARAEDAGARVRCETTVTGWVDAASPAVRTTSPTGLEVLHPRALLVATGARERPRSARLVAGSRVPGVWTTGQLQQQVHLWHGDVGTRAVVVGAELVSFSALMTLRESGCQVVAMATPLSRPATFQAAAPAARLRFGVPLLTRSSVTRVLGRDHVDGVEVVDERGVRRVIGCDTVVFTGDWIPDHELARAGGLAMAPGSRAPVVDTTLATSRQGVFAAGNLIHPVETADVSSLGGRHAAETIAQYLRDGPLPRPVVRAAVREPLGWVSPGLLDPGGRPPCGRFTLWATEEVPRARVEVVQGTTVLHRSRVPRGLLPGRPVHVGSDWLSRVDPAGGEVVFAVA